MKRLRLAFMGSPAFSVPALEALHQRHEVVCVYAQPPRPSGRGQKETPCPVHQAAIRLGIEVRTPLRVKRDIQAQEAFAALDLDAAVVAAYGLILPKAMLEAPKRGCLNIHASLLPRWRGASPIQAAILAGDAESGITIMRMEEGLDTGPMLLRESLPIGPRMTAGQLHDALMPMGARLILRALEEKPAEVLQPAEGVTYAGKISKEDGRIDWAEAAAALDRRVRALSCFFAHRGESIRLLEAEPVAGVGKPGEVIGEGVVACGTGALRLLRLQRAGRGAMGVGDFLRGYPLRVGEVLG